MLQIKKPERTRRAVDYLRANPHRLHLGTIGFDISDASKISGIEQNLDLWTGKIDSKFEYGVMKSMGDTAAYAGVPIVTGDTKVMGAGELDKMVVSTAAIGKRPKNCKTPCAPPAIRPTACATR